MNFASHTESSAPLPYLIQQALEQLGATCRTSPAPTAQPAQRVQAVLLEDAIGCLLVLYPQDSLLDLNRLTELTGRPLTAARVTQQEYLLARHGLDALPGLPLLPNLPCLYENALLAQPRLLLESGRKGVWLDVSREGLQRVLAKSGGGTFCVPLTRIRPNLDHPEQDVEQISQAVQSFTARRIQQRLEKTIEIPPLPHTAQRIIKLRVDPNTTVDDITGIVETDPALAAQVVSWAASPYYAAPGRIRSVEDAIVRVLGFDLVINLALGLALGKSLSLPEEKPRQATPYWQQAIYTAAVIEGLGRAIPRPRRPEMGLAYLGGLLHNFGYLVLAHVFPPHFALLCRHQEVNPHLHHSLIEQHLLGITREQVGAWLMRYWGMPDELCTALRFQHDPAYRGELALYPNLIALAVRLLSQRGIGSDPAEAVPDELYERVGLERERAAEAVDKVLAAEAALRDLAKQFGPSPGRP